MVIDTSALVAILFGEPESERLASAIAADTVRLLSTSSALECAVVVEARKGAPGGRDLDLLLHRCGIRTVSFDNEQYQIAKDAWRRYGKGRHPAALNIGDCCSYAVAKVTGEALLFKGDDFAQTDIDTVSY